MCGAATILSARPSKRWTKPRSALQSRAAFSASVSKTGWRSRLDRADDPSSSLVAVCCSRVVGQLAVARLQLREQAHVLDRDDGLVGEGLEERDLLLGEEADPGRRTMITPIATPSLSKGTARSFAKPMRRPCSALSGYS